MRIRLCERFRKNNASPFFFAVADTDKLKNDRRTGKEAAPSLSAGVNFLVRPREKEKEKK